MTDRLGTIGQQYSDDAGNPLIDGKLFIYESGTLTKKDTFADINLTILNTNPVKLDGAGRQPNVWFDGFAKIILTSSDDVQIEERDPIGSSTGGAFSSWTSTVIYGEDDLVKRNRNFYRSLAAGNSGNDPATDTSSWTRVQFTETWNTNDTYTIDVIVQGSDGKMYVAITSSNSGNDPISDTVNWVIVGVEPNIVLLSSVVLSTDTSADIAIPEGFTNYILKLISITTSSTTTLRLRTSTDGGSTFADSNGDYLYTFSKTSSTAATVSAEAAGAGVSSAVNLSGAGGYDVFSGNIEIFDPATASKTIMTLDIVHLDSNSVRSVKGSALRDDASDVDTVRIFPSSGTMDTGTIQLYGIL